MKEMLYKIVMKVAEIHEKILTLNNANEYYFTDKTLHFLVMGFIGMGLIFVVHPIFKILAKTGHTMVISWIYVITLMVVLTFAIEIGQKITGTGIMEFADIVYGLVGFIYMFIIFLLFRFAYHGVVKLIKKSKKRK